MSCKTCEFYDLIGFGQACPCTHHQGKCIMPRAIRGQADVDDDQEKISHDTGLDTGTDTLVRPEFQAETDINQLLQKFGVDTTSRQPTYGQTVDYNLDLQTALGAVAAAKRADMGVPQELRQKYPTWQSVLNGAETGEYQNDLQALADKRRVDDEAKQEASELQKEKANIARRTRAETAIKREKEDTAS